MSTPVTTDDIVQGAQKYLAAYPDVRAVLGHYPGTSTPYLFQHRLWVNVKHTQSTAAILTRTGGFTTPNQHNTMRFPRLGVELWVDPIRDDDNNVVDPGEVYRRADAAHKVIDRHLHRPQNGAMWWGSRRVISSTRLIEPTYLANPDGSGPLRVQSFYAVCEG